MKVLATGATGKFASLVVPALVARGIEVRALAHDSAKADLPRRLGAHDIVEGDLAQPQTLTPALDGMDGAFLITPAFAPNATEMALNLISAAEAAGVTKLVYNGVYHPSLRLTNHASTRPVEEALYRSDLDFTILQPAMYMQGIEPVFRDARRTGSAIMPWSRHARMTYVDYRDVAEAAAIAFTDDRLGCGTFELAAGGTLTRIQLAELMSTAARTPIIAEDPSPDDSPGDQPEGLTAMFDDYDKHGFHGGNSLVLQTILGHQPRTVAAYLNEIAAS